jgi:nickel-type superoxide dismutase maturation protease
MVRRIVVAGPSMLPTLAEGERVLARRVRRVRVGDLVVCRAPEDGLLLVKRVVSCANGAVEVRGDNEGASVDSRHFGALDGGAVLGVVFYRYHPPAAAGLLPRGPR